jgi:hypothetical protein
MDSISDSGLDQTARGVLNMYVPDSVIWIGISQKTDDSLIGLLSLPINTQVNQIRLMTHTDTVSYNNLYISPAGTNEWLPFSVPSALLPGDYHLRCDLNSSVVGFLIHIDSSTRVNNEQIYQAIGSLTRALGYQQSHLLKQVNRSNLPMEPLYRKIRTDFKTEIVPLIAGLESKIKDVENKINSQPHQELQVLSPEILIKDNPEHLITISELRKENDRLITKLQESEDYIESLMDILKNLGVVFK